MFECIVILVLILCTEISRFIVSRKLRDRLLFKWKDVCKWVRIRSSKLGFSALPSPLTSHPIKVCNWYNVRQLLCTMRL